MLLPTSFPSKQHAWRCKEDEAAETADAEVALFDRSELRTESIQHREGTQTHEFPSPSTARGSCATFADDQGATLHVAPAQHFDAIRQKL